MHTCPDCQKYVYDDMIHHCLVHRSDPGEVSLKTLPPVDLQPPSLVSPRIAHVSASHREKVSSFGRPSA